MRPQMLRGLLCGLIVAHGFSLAAAENRAGPGPIKLEQIISREDPKFDCAISDLTIGRDGMVYLTSAGHDSGYILRISRDGQDKVGGAAVPAIGNATADANGLIASSNGHFSHQVAFYDKDFQKINAVTDFLVSDQVGWDAPADVEAGAGGDFYGLDQHRDRILRIDAAGKLVKSYALPHVEQSQAAGFRVCEKLQAFYVVVRYKPEMECLGFDGKLKWRRAVGASVSTPYGDDGGFDVDDDGMLCVIRPNETVIHKFAPDGTPAGEIKLSMPPPERKSGFAIRGMRIWDGKAFLRFRHPSELFQVYDLATGKFERSVSIDHERLAATMPGGPWTAGSTVDFKIEFDGGGQKINPIWRVWARPFGVLDYRELKIADGSIQVPKDFAGLYQIKVTPEATPWQKGTTASEYKIVRLVEVRSPGAVGSVAVATKSNRVWFGRGEAIPFSILVRAPKIPQDTELTIALSNEPTSEPANEPTTGKNVFARAKIQLVPGVKELKFLIPASLTARLRPGKYVIEVAGKGLTCVDQPLSIGPGMHASPFFTVQYGDYGPTYPEASSWDAPDIVAAAVARNSRLGFNLMVDRLGINVDAVVGKAQRAQIDAEYNALAADATATSPTKLEVLPSALQAIAGYGATGANQMAILMGNDAGLPLGGPGFDGRKPDQMFNDLTTVTTALSDFPAFRGWSWASNWWVFGTRGSAAAKTPEEKTAYDAALKRAVATGAWDDVLDRVAGYRLSYAVDAQAMFNKKLAELARGKVTAVACPFRNVESYPPITLSNVDETDLQAQWEQVSLSLHGPMNVDFYKRPRHKAWGHPEVWNDAGTGEQILPVLWQMVMRGADGVGCSGTVPQWYFAIKGNTDDPRLSWNGLTSVYRSLNGVLNRYGPWFAAMRNDDAVAIVASGRMFKIDEWSNVMGRHFARVMEAYAACLYAHRPASIVFAEDLSLKPDTLDKYRAVLVVGQRVEMEPALAVALKRAKDAGVAIFADGACRAELVKDFTPLGLAFDKFEKDPSPAADDHAYWRFAAYAKADAAVLSKALAAVKPVAQVENPEVFITERQAGQGRYLFVVNNTMPDELDPGNLWRVTLATSSLVPQVVPVKLDLAQGEIVYDVFAGKAAMVGADGVVQADCRSTPARIYAILPAAIVQVQIKGPKQITGGEAMRCEVQVHDAAGKSIDAAVPVRVRLRASDGSLLEERYASVSSLGASGEFTVPIDLPTNVPSGSLSLEAVELLSGKCATLKIPIADAKFLPLDLSAAESPGVTAPVAAEIAAVSGVAAREFSPADESFGPHVRDLVVTDGGKLAIMNAMNWDNNLYAVDLESGNVRWRQRVGHYFAFEPMALSRGAAVQGFDLNSAQGYHLYLIGADGKLERRFALYGLPNRLPHRFVPALVRDHINSFAVGDDGKWIATAGDLGLAVWSRDGKVLWQQDWFKHDRHAGKVIALDASTLLVIEGMTATAYSASDGQQKWRLPLGRRGEIRIARVSDDSKTCGLYNTADGGKLSILRDGKILRVIPTAAEDFSFSADGSRIAVVSENALKLYSVSDGLQWIFNGDDLMHFPRFSTDGRLATTSGLGTLCVTDLAGRTLLEKDTGALAVPAWLADGSLLLATWEGAVSRLDKNYAEQWRTHLTPEATDMRGKILADDGAPTTRINGWGNATEAASAKPADMSESLLAKATPLITLMGASGQIPMTDTLRQKASMLYDGKAARTAQPWIPWEYVGTFAETSPINYIVVDAFRKQMKVTGVTLVEDSDHPESWLRDASIEFWDAASERWVPIQPLLSNAAVHTHMFAKPVEAARFRLMLPWGVCGNLRLAQIIFHGELLGCSHPDAIAKRPLAVLFDEQEDIKHDLDNVSFALEGAYSGGRCLTLTAAPGGEARATPPFRQQFGETIRNWDFDIAEKPEPGQYRYLQFAWKALSPKTSGMTLRLSTSNYGGFSFVAGAASEMQGATILNEAETPPSTWKIVRVDLWALNKKPWQVRSLCLGAKGGGAAFDQIVLARAESDLPKR
jgi:outer membrane protein assembly factor BamB